MGNRLYSFHIPEAWTTVAAASSLKLLEMINKVKDRSKQISLTLWFRQKTQIMNYPECFTGIYKFHLRTKSDFRCNKTCASEMFSGIHHVVLENVFGIDTLKAELRIL
jgi:hypothetical protein